MDFNALQHKLFALDPTDPREDLAKLKAQAQGGDIGNIPAAKDYVRESVQVPQGSMPLSLDNIADFAKLAGLKIDEKQHTGSAGQAKGSDPMPAKSRPSRSGEQSHPLRNKLVGEEEVNELKVVPRGTATPANINQTLTSIQSQLQSLSQIIQQLQNAVQQMTQQQQRSSNPNRQTTSLSQMPSMDLNSKQNKKIPLESVESIKDTLYAALAKKGRK